MVRPGPPTASAKATEIYDVGTNTWSLGANYPLLISFTSGVDPGRPNLLGRWYCERRVACLRRRLIVTTRTENPSAILAIADLPATRWGAATAF